MPAARALRCLCVLTLTRPAAVTGQSGPPAPAATGSAVLEGERGFDPGQSAGLFVGIREFEDGQLATNPYAVDDAVDLAHLFSLELQLIAPRNVALALAGEPQKDASRERLEALRAAGAREIKTGKREIGDRHPFPKFPKQCLSLFTLFTKTVPVPIYSMRSSRGEEAVA